MRLLLCFSFIILVAGAHIVGMRNLQSEEFFNHYSLCLESSQVDIRIALQTAGGVIENDPKLKEFLFCINKQNGLQDYNGTLIKENIRSKIALGLMSSKSVESVIQKCASQKESPQETAYHFLKCSYNTIVK